MWADSALQRNLTTNQFGSRDNYQPIKILKNIGECCTLKTTWCPKLTGLIIATVYFVAITLIHNSPYVWLSLTIVVILCLTTFACNRDKPILRFGSYTRNEPQEEVNSAACQVWTTDIPPSYSFIMDNQSIAPSIIISQPGTPGTPPPTYGSAILKFPEVTPKEKDTSTVASPILRHVLDRNLIRSVSRQVSVENALERDGSRGFSRQNSEISTGDDLSGIVIVCKPQLVTAQTQTSTPTSPTLGRHKTNENNEEPET